MSSGQEAAPLIIKQLLNGTNLRIRKARKDSPVLMYSGGVNAKLVL
jgi:hypothetical protein